MENSVEYLPIQSESTKSDKVIYVSCIKCGSTESYGGLVVLRNAHPKEGTSSMHKDNYEIGPWCKACKKKKDFTME